MTFEVPQGGSAICHIEVHPVAPVGGKAQVWAMLNTSVNPPVAVDNLDVNFARASSPEQRQTERMIFVFTIAQDTQTTDVSWRFTQDGFMYCQGEADYLDDLGLALSNNGNTLTGSLKCLTDTEEKVNFSLMAIRKDNVSGECTMLASADPGGSWGRR